MQNIISVFNEAKPLEVLQGMRWYQDAHELARGIADTVERGAGVIAALSPVTSWDRNVMLAQRAFLTGEAYGNTKPNVAKAQAILDGIDPLEVLGGFKVRSFYQNILEPDNTEIVTIDRHAYDIAAGIKYGDKTRPNINKGRYYATAEKYKIAAKELNILPSQLQAITWVSWRRKHNV